MLSVALIIVAPMVSSLIVVAILVIYSYSIPYADGIFATVLGSAL